MRTQSGSLDSCSYSGTQPDLVEQIENKDANIIMENHEYGMPPDHYVQWPELNETFAILTTTKDRKGVEYVSTIEHKHFPFFGSQVCCPALPISHRAHVPCAIFLHVGGAA